VQSRPTGFEPNSHHCEEIASLTVLNPTVKVKV